MGCERNGNRGGSSGEKESKRGVFPPGTPFCTHPRRVVTRERERDARVRRRLPRDRRRLGRCALLLLRHRLRRSDDARHAHAGRRSDGERRPASSPPRGPPRRRGDVLGEGRAEIVLDDERAAGRLREAREAALARGLAPAGDDVHGNAHEGELRE